MKHLAALVQPLEAVYSPTGELRKERHLDDLEDASSLIEGETPIPKSKQTRTRKRLPLREKDTNAPRLVKRKIKTEYSMNSMTAMEQGGNELPPLPYLHSSSTIESYSFEPRSLQSGDDDIDIKPRLHPLVNRRRPASFKIFDDGSPVYHRNGSTVGESSTLGGAAPPVLSGSSRTQISTNTALWLHPQHPGAAQYSNPYASQNLLQRPYSGLYDDAHHKENIIPSLTPVVRFGVHTANPLSWRSPLPYPQDIAFATELPFENLLGIFPHPAQSDDPFMATRNPFAEALPHFSVGETVMIKQD